MKEHSKYCIKVRFDGRCNCGVEPLRCDDCGRFAKADDLVSREPWLGGNRHRRGTGCWPIVNNLPQESLSNIISYEDII